MSVVVRLWAGALGWDWDGTLLFWAVALLCVTSLCVSLALWLCIVLYIAYYRRVIVLLSLYLHGQRAI